MAKKRKKLRPFWKKTFFVSTIFLTLIASISSIPVHADYVPGTLTQIAKLQHINLSNPNETKKLIVNFKAGQANIPVNNLNLNKTKVKVSTPSVVNNPNIETAKIEVSIHKKKTEKNQNIATPQLPANDLNPTKPNIQIDKSASVPDKETTLIAEAENTQEKISESVTDTTQKTNAENVETSKSNINTEDPHDTQNISENNETQTENKTDIQQDEISSNLTTSLSAIDLQKNELELSLATDEITIWNGNPFNPESFISNLKDENNTLPNLQIKNSVDTKKDGKYEVEYKVVSASGKSIEKKLIVNVKTPDEVIQKKIEEKKKQEEAEKKARNAEQEKEKQKAQQENIQYQANNNIPLNLGMPAVDPVGASLNPYQIPNGYWSNCTWGAWQLVYQNEGIRLPHFGNASEWYYDAIAAGYSVDSNPRVGDVAVYGGGNGLGHVAYVAQVSADGNSVYVQQGNYGGYYTEKWNHRYSTSISGMPLLGYIHVK